MDRKILYLKKWMQSNLTTKYTNTELAQMVELSTSHFMELFKTEVGKSPKQYLKDLRMEKAKELLETTFLSVKRICFEVGINDQRDFSRDFKKKYGLSPTEYSKQHWQKIEDSEVNSTKSENSPQEDNFYLVKRIDK